MTDEAHDDDAPRDPFASMLDDAVSMADKLLTAERELAGDGTAVERAQLAATILHARCTDQLRQAITRAAARSAGSGTTLDRIAMGPPVNELDEQIAVFEHGMQQAQAGLMQLRRGVLETCEAADAFLGAAADDGLTAEAQHAARLQLLTGMVKTLRALAVPQ